MKNGKQSMIMEHSLARCEVRSLYEGSQRQGLHHCYVTFFPVRLGSDRLKPKNAWRAVVCFCFHQRKQTWTLHSTTCRMWHCTDGVRWRNSKSTCYPFKQLSMFSDLKCVCAQNITTAVNELGVVFLVLGSHMPNLSVNRSCSYWFSMHTFILL